MAGDSVFSRVPVIDVHQDNLKEVWPSLALAVKSATFIGMDLELSGLGNRKRLNAKDIDDRYTVMAEVARTRSVLSLGLSCFKLTDVGKVEVKASEGEPGSPTRAKNNWNFLVQTFNILVLCTEDFIVEPVTLKFLVDHGFDFNNQYAKGIPYYRGNDQPTDDESPSLRQLMNILVLSKTPVVFHNALVDLVFLYHSLYASLPTTVSAFSSDLTEVFGGGVFDTKYITEYVERLPASYLEYAFRRCQRNNSFSMAHVKHMVSLEFFKYPSSYTYVRNCRCDLPECMVEKGDDTDAARLQKILCHQYASFGWCPLGSSCPKSHDIDDIIDLDALKPARLSRKRKRRRQKQKNSNTDSEKDTDEKPEEDNPSFDDHNSQIDDSMDSDDPTVKKSRVNPLESNSTEVPGSNPVENGECKTFKQTEPKVSRQNNTSNTNDLGIARKEGHRAGYDAFMTGYILACFVAKHGRLPEDKRRNLKLSDLSVSEFKDKIYLCGKDIPMVITKSAFSKTSKDHREKMKKLTS